MKATMTMILLMTLGALSAFSVEPEDFESYITGNSVNGTKAEKSKTPESNLVASCEDEDAALTQIFKLPKFLGTTYMVVFKDNLYKAKVKYGNDGRTEYRFKTISDEDVSLKLNTANKENASYTVEDSDELTLVCE